MSATKSLEKQTNGKHMSLVQIVALFLNHFSLLIRWSTLYCHTRPRFHHRVANNVRVCVSVFTLIESIFKFRDISNQQQKCLFGFDITYKINFIH